MVSDRQTKEEMKEDRVLTAANQAVEYARKNARWVLVAVAVLVAGIVVAVLVSQGRVSSERQASMSLLGERRGSTRTAATPKRSPSSGIWPASMAVPRPDVWRTCISGTASWRPGIPARPRPRSGGRFPAEAWIPSVRPALIGAWLRRMRRRASSVTRRPSTRRPPSSTETRWPRTTGFTPAWRTCAAATRPRRSGRCRPCSKSTRAASRPRKRGSG